MADIKHVVITMAGMGTRLGKECPKGLIDIKEHKLVYYMLQLIKDIPDVRIVVGYCAQDVIDYVRKFRSDVSFVRNDDYATTSCAYSINLACKDIAEPYLIIDGDLILNKKSFETFIDQCKNETVIGVTRAKTEHAVFVDLDEEQQIIKAFTRKPGSSWEWSGLAYVKDFIIDGNLRFICDTLEKKLPLKYLPIECFEIDTPADYQEAIDGFETLGYA